MRNEGEELSQMSSQYRQLEFGLKELYRMLEYLHNYCTLNRTAIDKILKKVGEEATEIIIAAKNPDPEEIKYEISDFLYHVMVLMAERGVTWEDITKELAKR